VNGEAKDKVILITLEKTGMNVVGPVAFEES
jgi:hypothetical protein